MNFYWAGTDFSGRFDPRTGENDGPSVVTDNMTARYSETGAPLFAAFDQGVDLENSQATQTTLAHSAGAPLAGTAERRDHGMTTDKLLYLAPAGTGHNVGSPEDTVNPNADHAVVQTREDPIKYSQRLGGSHHGPNFLVGGDPTRLMDAPRLETGYAEGSTPEKPIRVGDGPAGGHSDLWNVDTTSRANIEAFIYEDELVPELPDRLDYSANPKAPVLIDGLDDHPEITESDGFDEFKRPYDEVIR